MVAKVAKTRGKPKSATFPKRQEKKSPAGGLLAVMQNVQAVLEPGTAAKTLHFFTDQPISTCEKLLSGHRLPNPETLAALCQSKLVIETVLGLTAGGTDPVVRDVHKAVMRLQLERKLAQLDANNRD